jgi:hypothetical protein
METIVDMACRSRTNWDSIFQMPIAQMEANATITDHEFEQAAEVEKKCRHNICLTSKSSARPLPLRLVLPTGVLLVTVPVCISLSFHIFLVGITSGSRDTFRESSAPKRYIVTPSFVHSQKRLLTFTPRQCRFDLSKKEL